MDGGRGRISAIESVCRHLTESDPAGAAEVLRQGYAHLSFPSAKRGYSLHQKLDRFIEDGFIDRYSGDRLLFPGVLHVLSAELPDAFPRHKNWKMANTHIAYWELMPTIDHLVPIARGGLNEPENWVTTSMARNSAKANWTLEELQWQLAPKGRIEDWDGMMSWFARYVAERSHLLAEGRIKEWHRTLTYRPEWVRLNTPRGPR